jgi:MFS family permease
VPGLAAVLRFGRERIAADPLVLALAAASIVASVLFLIRERRAENPIIHLGFFTKRDFWSGNLLGFLAAFAMFGFVAYMPLFAQTLAGGSALHAGLIITPMSLSWSSAAFVAGRMAHRAGEVRLIRSGAVIMAAGFTLALASGVSTPGWYLMLCSAVAGLGMGCQTPSLMLTVQRSLDARDIGVATSTQMLARTIGGAVGVAILGALLWGAVGGALNADGGQAILSGSPEDLFSPGHLAVVPPNVRPGLLGILAGGMRWVFGAGIAVVVLSLLFSSLLRGKGDQPDSFR